VMITGGYTGLATTNSVEFFNPANGNWSTSPSTNMGATREWHTSTLLRDGRVLVTGGQNNAGTALNTTEIFNPTAGTWTAGPVMAAARLEPAATLLLDGRVLIIGGFTAGSATNSVQIFNPTTNQLSAATNLPTGVAPGRARHTAALYPNGRVVVVGGNDNSGPVSLVQEYDPATNQWSGLSGIPTAREDHTMVMLPNGRLGVYSGYDNLGTEIGDVRLYNRFTNSWSLGPAIPAPPAVALARAESVVMPDGEWLIVDGENSGTPTSQAAVVTVMAPEWRNTGSLQNARRDPVTVTMPDGRILLAGGDTNSPAGALSGVEIYDPATGTWTGAPAMGTVRSGHAGWLSPNGDIFMVGGSNRPATTPVWHNTAEFYTPGGATWTAMGTNIGTARDNLGGVLLRNGDFMVAGGENGGGQVNACNIYRFATGTWTGAATLSGARSMAVLAMLQGGDVIVCGGLPTLGTNITQRYTPGTNNFSAHTGFNTARFNHPVVRLPEGSLMMVGGSNGSPVNTPNRRFPGSNNWASGALQPPSSGQARWAPGGQLLVSGRALFFGGGTGTGSSTFSESFIPAGQMWRATGPIFTGRYAGGSAQLRNGEVLFAAGWNAALNQTEARTELFNEGRGFSSDWQPHITQVGASTSSPHTATYGATLTIQGLRFRGVGGVGDAVPQVTVQGPISGTSLVQLADGSFGEVRLPVTNFASGTSLDVQIPTAGNAAKGYYHLRVIVNGIYSRSWLIRLP